jgi:RND family efflux transporter MFP subunit
MAQNGDAVKKGQPLVRIRPPGARAQVSQAQSSLAAARAGLEQSRAEERELAAEYERQRTLGDRGLVPRSVVDSLRAQLEAARAASASARAQVAVADAAVSEQREIEAQTIVRAPISGRIGQRNAEVGMVVDTQTALFTIGQLDEMRVEVPVTQDIVARIEVGQRVELSAGGSGEPIEAKVSRLSPFLESGSFSAEVEIDVPNDRGALVPGMFVTVDIFYGESAPTTLVPTSALYESDATGERGVFVASTAPAAQPASMRGDRGHPDPVRVVFRRVEIVAEAAQTAGVVGVKPGERVVVIGQHLLAANRASDGAADARLRAMDWDEILKLQRLQREDLLREFLERQQRAGTGE